MRDSLMVRYWAHNPGTDNACASSTLAPATNTSGCRLIWLGHRVWGAGVAGSNPAIPITSYGRFEQLVGSAACKAAPCGACRFESYTSH